MTIIFSLDEITTVAKQILATTSLKKVVTFHAQMGAGKTTLIKDFCKILGVKGNTSSPTFALVNEYKTESGKSIYHFDMYRIEDPSEAIRIGFEEYLESGNYCFIEWPEKIHNLLPPSFVQISFQVTPDHRKIIANK